MKFSLEIDCDNDAFTYGGLDLEVARILRGLAEELELKIQPDMNLRDANGNLVGLAKYEK